MSRKPKRRTHLSVSARKELNDKLEQAEKLLERNRPHEIIDLLEPLLERFGSSADLALMLGLTYMQTGDHYEAVLMLERAVRSIRSPALKVPLGIAYLDVEMAANAVTVWTEAQRAHEMLPDDVYETLGELRSDLREQAEELKMPVKRVLEGLCAMERCRFCLVVEQTAAAVKAGRTAVRILPKFGLSHGNLSLALFQDGRIVQALEATQKSLAIEPENPSTMATAIQYLFWIGRPSEAEELWLRLQDLPGSEPDMQLQRLRAAAVLEKDEAVYAIAQPLTDNEIGDEDLETYIQLLLATAEANLGDRKQALNRLRRASVEEDEHYARIISAMEAGRSSLGYTGRFSYTDARDMVPMVGFEAMERLMKETMGRNDVKARRQIDQLAKRYPQLMLLGEKLIWEEDEGQSGIELLAWLATPETQAELRRFGLSQAGPPKMRMRALLALDACGGAEADEVFRFWHNGNWIDVDLQTQTFVPPEPEPYSDEVIDLMLDGMAAQRNDDTDTAVDCFQKALELDPNVRDACNNLGTIFAQRGDIDEGYAMYERALDIDPNYTLARLNFAALQIECDDLEGVKGTLAPLDGVDSLDPDEIAFYNFLLAQIAISENRFDDAQHLIDKGKEADPHSDIDRILRAQMPGDNILAKAVGGVQRLLGKKKAE